ncbi:hypothetical protein BJ138DRAFT_1020965, partial [Hygrophoropsis aurantiaca]
MSPNHSFSAYSTPNESSAYSTHYFNHITFERAAGVEYPTIAPAGAVSKWFFHADIPANAQATLILPGEIIFHVNDVQPIIQEMESAFMDGARSVCIEALIDGEIVTRVYHFAKIRSFVLINNHKHPILLARQLFGHVTTKLNISQEYAESFAKEIITRQMQGLYVTDFPLWKLGYLLDENWVEEDVLNSLAEMLYFRLAAESVDRDPTFLFLPTLFFNDARQLYHQPEEMRSYSVNMLALRERLRSTNVDRIAFLIWEQNHYAAYCYQKSSHVLHNDSMGLAPANDALEILSWLLDGLKYPMPQYIQKGALALQTPTMAHGSCGIAAHNFIESLADDTIPHWTSATSPAFRDKALRDLILFDQISKSQNRDEFLSWVHLAGTPLMSFTRDELKCNNGFVGFNDFNLYSPLATHPINRFFVINGSQPLIDNLPERQPALKDGTTRQLNKVPSLDKLQTGSSSNPIMLGSPLHIDMTWTPPRKTTKAVINLIDDTPPLSQPRKSKTLRFDSSPIFMTSPIQQPSIHSSRSAMMPVTLESRNNLKRRRSFQENIMPIIVLTSDSEDDKRTTKKQCLHHANEKQTHSHRELTTIGNEIRLGTVFRNLEEATNCVYARERNRGHRWRRGQSKKSERDGKLKKLILRCNHYYHSTPTHSPFLDPSDHRKGKTVKTDCDAHVNLNHILGTEQWKVTFIKWEHNHDREIPIGGVIPKPPTQEQRRVVSNFASSNSFTRAHIKTILADQFPNHPLEPRQVSNMINQVRQQAQKDVQALGGDVAAIITCIQSKIDEGERWNYRLRLDESQTVVGLWWQSPDQNELSQRYFDIIINDNT